MKGSKGRSRDASPSPRASRATSRRRFLALVGAAGLSTTLATPAALLAQSVRTVPKPKPQREPVSPAKPDTALKVPPPPPEFADDAKALTAVVQRRYGQHLDAKQLEAVTKEMEQRMQGGKALRAAKLANSDEPDFSFHA